jgi:hypothetical protein
MMMKAMAATMDKQGRMGRGEAKAQNNNHALAFLHLAAAIAGGSIPTRLGQGTRP